MSEKTLVCVLAQTRAHRLTWSSFEENVLNELNADLAVCIGVDQQYEYSNPYFQNARFRWMLPEPGDYAAEIERVRLSLGCREDWRQLLNPGGTFLGGVCGMPGAGGLLLVYRWFLRNSIILEGLLGEYDRFVITRSDFIFVAPHPCLDALDPRFIWLPNGEDWGGLVDRHAVLNKHDLAAGLATLSDLLRHPGKWLDILYARDETDRNIEYVLKAYFARTGLLPRVRRFPYVMFLVRGDGDPTRSKAGDLDSELGLYVKYPTEFAAATQSRERFRTRQHWLAWGVRHPEGEPPLEPPEADDCAGTAQTAARRLPSARRLNWLANNGKAADAVRLLDGVDLADELDADFLYIAGVCLGSVGQERTAIGLLERAAAGGFDKFWSAYHLGLFEMRSGRTAQAAFYFTVSVILNPDRTDILALLAQVGGDVELGLLSTGTAGMAAGEGTEERQTAFDLGVRELEAGRQSAAAFYFALTCVCDTADDEARRGLLGAAPGVMLTVLPWVEPEGRPIAPRAADQPSP